MRASNRVQPVNALAASCLSDRRVFPKRHSSPTGFAWPSLPLGFEGRAQARPKRMVARAVSRRLSVIPEDL